MSCHEAAKFFESVHYSKEANLRSIAKEYCEKCGPGKYSEDSAYASAWVLRRIG